MSTSSVFPTSEFPPSSSPPLPDDFDDIDDSDDYFWLIYLIIAIVVVFSIIYVVTIIVFVWYNKTLMPTTVHATNPGGDSVKFTEDKVESSF